MSESVNRKRAMNQSPDAIPKKISPTFIDFAKTLEKFKNCSIDASLNTEMLALLQCSQSKIDQLERDVASKQDTITALRDVNALLKEKSQASDPLEDKIIKRSLVISNMGEVGNTQEEIIKNDTQHIRGLLSELDAYAHVESSFRMGTSGGNKPRLLKLQLRTSAQANDVLKKAPLLKNSNYFKNISIRKSLPLEDRIKASERIKLLRDRIEELKKISPNLKYCIYADKICEKQLDGSKPKAIDDPLNIITPLTGANRVTATSPMQF